MQNPEMLLPRMFPQGRNGDCDMENFGKRILSR
jgi:hypothetical protein